MKVTQEIVTLFTDKGGHKAMEVSNGHLSVYRLVKMNREDRFRLLTELQHNGEKSEEVFGVLPDAVTVPSAEQRVRDVRKEE